LKFAFVPLENDTKILNIYYRVKYSSCNDKVVA